MLAKKETAPLLRDIENTICLRKITQNKQTVVYSGSGAMLFSVEPLTSTGSEKLQNKCR